jgi:ATP-binding cassette subfamily G (WHITE) protein 2 (SNQ2)
LGQVRVFFVLAVDVSKLTFPHLSSSTRGLDGSTSLEFVQALRSMTETLRVTTIASLYQAGEPLYRLFDKVCVVYEGRMAYFGPADQAKQYFIEMGYEPANRQTTADFLAAITDPNGRISRPSFSSLPRTAAEFASYFQKSQLGRRNKEDLQSYQNEFVGIPERNEAFRESVLAEHAKTASRDGPYTISIPMQVRAVMTRRVQTLRGNMLATLMNVLYVPQRCVAF